MTPNEARARNVAYLSQSAEEALESAGAEAAAGDPRIDGAGIRAAPDGRPRSQSPCSR